MPINRAVDPLSLQAIYAAIVAETQITQEKLADGTGLSINTIQTIAAGRKNVSRATADKFLNYIEKHAFPSEWPEYITEERRDILKLIQTKAPEGQRHFIRNEPLFSSHGYKMERHGEFVVAAGAYGLAAWCAQLLKRHEDAKKHYQSSIACLNAAMLTTDIADDSRKLAMLLANQKVASFTNEWNALLTTNDRQKKMNADRNFYNKVEECMHSASYLMNCPAYRFDVSILRNGLVAASMTKNADYAALFFGRLLVICGQDVLTLKLGAEKSIAEDGDFIWFNHNQGVIAGYPSVIRANDAVNDPLFQRLNAA